jgi:hypothetical protein
MGGGTKRQCDRALARPRSAGAGSSRPRPAVAPWPAAARAEQGVSLGWPKRCQLAHAFLWGASYKRLKLTQLLGQLGVFLTPGQWRWDPPAASAGGCGPARSRGRREGRACPAQPPAPAATARAGNRRFGLLSTLPSHTKAPYKKDLLWKTLRALNRPGRTGGPGPPPSGPRSPR